MDAFFTGKLIADKLVQLMAKIPYMQKDVDSKELRYKYLSYEAVADRVQETLVELKLASVPQFETVEESNYTTAKGAVWKYVRVRVALQLIDAESGEYCTATCEGSGTDPGDKAVAKAQTMAMKNVWCKLLNIPIGNDPEADPQTDREAFTPIPAAAAAPAMAFGFPQNEAEIVQCWQALGAPWDVNQIPSYVQNKFGRPPAQLTGEECYGLWCEFYGYVQSKQQGGQQ